MDAEMQKACVQELVLTQRSKILHALCSSGSAEHLEKVLDILLAQGEIIWEDYQNIQEPGRALFAKARQLLDLVYAKGVDACGLLLTAIKQVLPEAPVFAPSFLEYNSGLEEDFQSTPTKTLLTQRVSLVSELQNCIDCALDVLVTSGHFTKADCNEARRLLDHVRSKGESAAELLLRYIQQKPEFGSPLDQKKLTPSKEFLKYQKKLSSSLSAQSFFLCTYGGDSSIPLDHIYTEVQLEPAHGSADFQGPLGPEDIVSKVGSQNEEADTVLVSGQAGSGKSTLLQRFHLLWARGAALQDFLLLFPVSCRRLNSLHKELSIRELLFQHCCWPDKEQEDIFQFILDNPHLILLTFDGLDEFKHSFSDECRICSPTQRVQAHVLLFSLIQGSLMKGVRKVVTSRPEAVGPELKKYICKEVILKGFSINGIDCFVRKHHSDSTVATMVLESLKTNTALLGLCHSPVLCWIVSHCHNQLLHYGEGTPQTITDVYLMILQHFLQHKSSVKSNTDFSWLKEHLNTVLRLGQLAFEGIENNCYIFSCTDVEKCGITESDLCMGFLFQSKYLSSIHGKGYEFLHVTMQCFFAALYIAFSNNIGRSVIPKLFNLQDMRKAATSAVCFRACVDMSPGQKWTFVEETIGAETANLQITATFVSGLLSQRHQCLWLLSCPKVIMEKRIKQVVRCLSTGMQKHFKSIPQPVEGEKKSMHAMPGFVWLVTCIYEKQDSRIAKDVMHKLEVTHLKLTYCNIGPVECTALAYVLQYLRNPVGLQLDNNFVGDVGVEQLLPCMHICNSLYLRNNNITDVGICKLIAKVIHCDSVQKLALFNNKLTDACIPHFSHLLKTRPDFLSLRLGNNKITAEGAKLLAEGLKFSHSLQYLGLWGNMVGDTGAEALAKALENSKSLVWLSLVGNSIGSAGACSLANLIKTSTSLEELWLTENRINRTGVECLIQALEHNTHVKSIWLRNNDLSMEEVETMGQRESRLVF
ncbi:nucleotide-binding oligomerization domain-containing protein 2 isoform X2 [Antennarius striatus]|uniref:nucleotide-binding oligomerization domain-containing protein 2 isoform X2 n=1 Tax=Antennarius striatus TaxID=241820 RepID=UPI0035B264D5